MQQTIYMKQSQRLKETAVYTFLCVKMCSFGWNNNKRSSCMSGETQKEEKHRTTMLHRRIVSFSIKNSKREHWMKESFYLETERVFRTIFQSPFLSFLFSSFKWIFSRKNTLLNNTEITIKHSFIEIIRLMHWIVPAPVCFLSMNIVFERTGFQIQQKSEKMNERADELRDPSHIYGCNGKKSVFI